MPELIDVTPGSPEWLAARAKGVTATDIVTICGLSSTDSAYALYYRKLGIIPDVPGSDRFRLGRELEPYIAERFFEANGFSGTRGGLWQSNERPWQMATPDRVHWDPRDGMAGSEVPDAVLELKSWADADRSRWDDGPPAAVRAQVLWQMDTLGVARGHVGVLFLPSGEFRSYVIESCGGRGDAEACDYCKDILLMHDASAEFMRRLAELDPPSPDGSAATLAALKARFADPRNDKVAVIDGMLWEAYDCHMAEVVWHKSQARLFEAQIRELAGEAGMIEVDGEVVARRQRYTVKAHMRRESTVDKIVRVKRRDDGDE